jgi:aspartyl-tRNA(Asn)/glutamyl-tRNA(Gln) amidotransferase subunit C
VRRIAALARLELAEDEVAALVGELERILEWTSALDEADLDGVPPTSVSAAPTGRLREDEPRPGLGAARALDPAPEREAELFRVPRVIEG